MKTDFYTYAYLREDGTPYYIGKGLGRRAFDRKRHRIKVPPKERILFLKTGLTEEEAFKHEIYMIFVFGRKDLGTGILRNLTEGGEGCRNLGEETLRKMEEAAKKGRKTLKLNLQKAVELTRMSDGEVIIFDCASDAARALNLNQGGLSAVCRGVKYSLNGFLARYWSPEVTDWGEGLSHKVEEIVKMRKKARNEANKRAGQANKSRSQKPVELTRMSDGSVFIYDCVSDAARDLNLDNSAVSKVCRGKLHATEGYLARYRTPDVTNWGEGLSHKIEEIRQKQMNGAKVSKQKTQKAVEITRVSDGKVFVYACLNEAARALNLSHGNLSSICLGKRKFTKGYTARYLAPAPSEP